MELFPFQRNTVDRLRDPRGILIAHDMGLGKTVTAIALDAERRKRFDNPAKTLIICPLSVIDSWLKHFKTWAPHLNVLAINNKNRKPFMEAMEDTFKDPYGWGYDVFIMHYPAVRLEPDVAKYPWFHVVCDEVHGLQDRKAAQTKAVKKIKAFYKTGMSGTPVFNKPDDLWSILNWLYPKYWTSYWGYFKRYIKWVEYDGYRTVIGVNNEEELQAKIAGFYSRIKKEEVLPDLPDKYFSEIRTKLHPQQARAYKQMKKDMLAWIGEHEHEPVSAPVVIAQLVRLQQFASAYAEVERYTVKVKEYLPSEEIKFIDEFMMEVLKSEGFEVFEAPEGADAEYCYVPNQHDEMFKDHEIKQSSNGGLYIMVDEERSRVNLMDPSSKIDAAMEIIQASDEPIVVFSQFSQMIELLGKRLEKAGISHGLYTGATSKADRDRIVNEFQAGKLRVFAGTIKAGGVGLTLTAANTVIILNREWAQALNEQCIDRLHRIGQKNAVHVIDIIAEDTIDVERNMGIEMNWKVIKKLLGE